MNIYTQNQASPVYQNNFHKNNKTQKNMKYENKEGQGSLFRNEKQSDRQPDYKGTILIGGATYVVAGWVKTSKKGIPYLSMQAALPKGQNEQPNQRPGATPTNMPENSLFSGMQNNGMPF